MCWLCRKDDDVSNLGQRGKTLNTDTVVNVWLASVMLVSWWLQKRFGLWRWWWWWGWRGHSRPQTQRLIQDFKENPHLLCWFQTKQTKVQKCGRHKVVPGFRALYYGLIKGYFEELCWSTHCHEVEEIKDGLFPLPNIVFRRRFMRP